MQRGGRKGFDRHGGVLCKNCFSLSLELQQLREENYRLKQTLNARNKQLSETKITHKDIENAHIPSSKRRNKKNATSENQAKVGGAKLGHPGHGRKSIASEKAEEVINVPLMEKCPECQVKLEQRDTRNRSVIEAQPLKAKKIIYRCPRGVCPQCLKTYTTAPTVLPKSLYGNSLIAQAVTLHFLHGMTIGKVLGLLGNEVSEGGLIHAFHRFAKLCEYARPSLIDDYRQSIAKHADETGWRTDGHSGYAWLFCTKDTTIFEFRDTRSSRVAKEILGTSPLPGVLTVDRYNGYNRIPCALQYCYAHLLREVEKLEEEFSDSIEVTKFVSMLSTELTKAMKLRGLGLSLDEYINQAKQIQSQIEQIVAKNADHLAVRRIQLIFREKKDRMYQWVQSPEISPENNRAERELRPTVIARKVSFGSQSKNGAHTRSQIMTVLWTAKKRFPDKPVEQWLMESLEKMTKNSRLTLADLLKTSCLSTPSN